MKRAITFTLFLGIVTQLFSQLNYFQRFDNYTFDYVPLELVGSMQPGQGIKVNDYIDYSASTYSPFLSELPVGLKAMKVEEPVDKAVIENSQFYMNANLSTESKARSYYINFKATFGFINAKMAYERALSEQSTSKTIQIVMETKKSGVALTDDKKIWTRTRLYQSKLQTIGNLSNLTEKTNQFVNAFGTHFIVSVQTGFRIEILATIHTKDATEQANFQASISAWIAKINAGASYNSTISSKNTEIICKISSGGIMPRMANIIQGFDDINNFLDSLKKGKYTIYNGPIGAYVQSYKGTLLDYPKISELFEPNNSIIHNDALPIGSIIAWSPKPKDIINGIITPPVGWSICNGDNNTPNLCDRFIMGVNKQQTNLYSSQDSMHRMLSGGTGFCDGGHCGFSVQLSGSGKAVGADHSHTVSVGISNKDVLPPFLSLVYIIKLE